VLARVEILKTLNTNIGQLNTNKALWRKLIVNKTPLNLK